MTKIRWNGVGKDTYGNCEDCGATWSFVEESKQGEITLDHMKDCPTKKDGTICPSCKFPVASHATGKWGRYCMSVDVATVIVEGHKLKTQEEALKAYLEAKKALGAAGRRCGAVATEARRAGEAYRDAERDLERALHELVKATTNVTPKEDTL